MPADPGYDEARARLQRHDRQAPRWPSRACRDVVADRRHLRAAFGRDHGVELAVRGGGHNAAGLGVWDDALVIDLSLLRSNHPSAHTEPHRPAPTPDAPGEISTTRPWAFGMATPFRLPRVHRRGRPDARRRPSATCPGASALPSTTSCPPTSCWPTARFVTASGDLATATCSGRLRGGRRETSASSRRSPSAATTSARGGTIIGGPVCSTTSRTPPR